MNIAIVDAFYDVSHRLWAEGWKKHSQHSIDIYRLPPRHWKWKMMGGSISLAQMINCSENRYDVMVVTDMVHLPLFKSLLCRQYDRVPITIYFHENQITYPWSPEDEDVRLERDHHYGFVNYSSALLADKILFNSTYHRDSFIGALPGFIGQFPDVGIKETVSQITQKSEVLYIGLDHPQLGKSEKQLPTFIWNHRWEYDKNPTDFFKTLYKLKEKSFEFEVIVLGKSYGRSPKIFEEAKIRLEKEIIHFGYAEDRNQYLKLLSEANIVVVTGYQDFFGISVVEAIAAGCYPLLPDRLAYPEHLFSAQQSQHIYNDEKELMKILQQVISDKLYLQVKTTSEYVQKYDWRNLISVYDDQLEQLMSDDQ